MKRISIPLLLSLISAPSLADTNKVKVNGDRNRTTTSITHNTTTNNTTTGLQELSIDNSNHASVPSPVIANSDSVPTISFYYQHDTVGNVVGTQLTIPLN